MSVRAALVRPSTLLSAWWTLSKGHLSVWVSLSALPGFLVSVPVVGVFPLAGIMAGTALCSASSQALNQALEYRRDALMTRTKNRPIPTGAISVEQAKRFALVTGISGAGLLTIAAGGSLAPAVIALSTIGLYVNAYTPLKTVSCYNTHIGAVAGSLPVLIGFACAGGFPILATPAPWLLFAIQTLWQFPHFYPLAWMYKDDYTKGGYQMFPLSDESGKETARMCFPYMIALGCLPFAASAAGVTSCMFPVSASVVTGVWMKQWWDFFLVPSKKSARTYFLGSLWYLLATMGLFAVHLEEGAEHTWRARMKLRLKSVCFHEGGGDSQHCPALRLRE